jgi:hypothetical protein
MCSIVILENYALLSEVPKSTIPYLECYLVLSPNIKLFIRIKLVTKYKLVHSDQACSFVYVIY